MADEIVEGAELREPGPLQCPKCRAVMAPVVFAGVEVDRCTGCGGIWFDLLEQEDLKRVKGSEAIDTGDPGVGRQFDRVGLIRCPVDAEPMVRMVDKGQPSLWLESCPVCYGMFFDAGEFADYKAERVRDLVFRHRRKRPL
jgi:Zn-finger nucleic acid-binding protein